MPTVYLVQMPTRYNSVTGKTEDARDISSAHVFGGITLPMFPKHGASYFTQHDVREVRKLLKDYRDEDSILLLGDPAAMALTVSLAAEINCGRYSVLRWDNRRREYMRMTFNIRGN